MNNVITNYFINYVSDYNKYYVELEEINNEFVFHLKKSIIFTKQFLIIKNRKTGKRVLKKFNKSKVTLSYSDLDEINELGVFDIFLEIHVHNSIFLKLINFNFQNYGKILTNHTNHRIFFPYKTSGSTLSFKYENRKFLATIKEFTIKNNLILLHGEMEMLQDISFDSVEIFTLQGTFRNIYPCEFYKTENKLEFRSEINFNVDFDEIGKHFKIHLRLKEGDIIVGSNELKWKKNSKVTNNNDRLIGKMDGAELTKEDVSSIKLSQTNENSEYIILFYIYLDYNLRYSVINKTDNFSIEDLF